MSSLMHHGVKGQRWGVRRYQNKDGTRTAAGKRRNFENETSRVINKLSNEPKPIKRRPFDKDKVRQRGLLTKVEADQCAELAAGLYKNAEQVEPKITGDVIRVVSSTSAKMYGLEHRLKQPTSIAAKIGSDAKGDGVSFEEAASGIKDTIRYTAVSDRRDYVDTYNAIKQRLRDNGYEETKCKNYFQKYQNGEVLHKAVQSTFKSPDGIDFEFQFQTPESQAAKELKLPIYNERRKAGNTPERNAHLEQEMRNLAELVPDPEGVFSIKSHSEVKNIKHTSIGGTMYIEGNALILGDSSYLEHHGIRGQRWGVRRFQNRDGSLTNAGRKRLGYATKGVTQTVGKAFKAGVKAGGNAVKAVKAHHEKKEAEKLQKKKEKASKTRLGVMANKDLFTNEEIRKLNERFKLEDEMKMATLQKGVEIAKAVGTIAQNVGTVAKTYEDVTGQSLSPIKRKAAEEKARQDKEDRERRIAREDADEARKAAKEERDIAIHEQTLRKAIASADTQEFTAQKTKAEADSSILDLYKKGQDFNGGSDATGKSWVEKAKNGGKNPFDDMIANRDPEYAQIRKEHEEKVARKERMAELERREKEREAEKAAARKQSPPQQKQSGGDDDALFSQKGSLPIDKDRYRNNRAMEKAKQVKEDAAEERAKKQDEKAAKATIDDMMEARRQFTDSARANSNGAFDRETAANYIKGKAKELPSKLNPINAISKKITDRALKEEEAASRKAMEDEYKKASRSQGRDEANYTMYYNRVNALQAQGYSERQAKKVADTENPFSSKRNRRFEYNEKVGEIETTHRKNAKEINKANKELTDYYYKLVNGPGYEPGSPKREALDREYAQKRGELERLEKDNNEMLDREKKKAKKILEHSLSIQNGVLFVDSSDGLAHNSVKGQRWGVRKFQNADGTLTEKGRKHYEKALAKEKRKQASSDAIRGTLERQHPFAVTGAAIMGAVSSGLTHASYSASEAWEGRGTRMRSKKIAKYENMLKQSDKGEGMYHIENGTLFINAREPYLEHHGVKGMKWGKHLMAGKGVDAEGGGGGGFAEDDEKLKEMAKKAGMSVAEYRTKMASKLSRAAAKAKKEIGYAYGSEYKKDFEKAARLHENNRKSMHAQAKAAWEGYGESRTAAQRDNWKRYAEYDRQAKASGNMFVKRERSKQAYDNSLASKVDSVKRKARLTQDKAKSKISDAVDAAKKTKDDVKSNIRSKTGIGVKKDIERNARLAEGQKRRAHELTKQVYSAKNKEDWARAYSESNKESFKALDNERKVKKDTKSYSKSIAGRVDSTKRKARLTKDRLKSALGKSKQRKQLSTEGPKAKKQISNARDDVEKAARANENAYKHAKAVYRQTGSDSDAYKQAIKRSGTTLQRYIDNKKLLEKKKRAKHLDETGAIYTEGTRLVVNSKWG